MKAESMNYMITIDYTPGLLAFESLVGQLSESLEVVKLAIALYFSLAQVSLSKYGESQCKEIVRNSAWGLPDQVRVGTIRTNG